MIGERVIQMNPNFIEYLQRVEAARMAAGHLRLLAVGAAAGPTEPARPERRLLASEDPSIDIDDLGV